MRLFTTSAGLTNEPISPVALVRPGRVVLQAEIANTALCFCFGFEGGPLVGIGPVCDATLLSDEAAKGIEPFHGSFTGAMFAVGVHDMSGGRAHADFEYLWYEDIDAAAPATAE